MARAPANVLAPFGYLEIVSATFLGYVLFSDFPAWPVAAPNCDFVPVGHKNTDGLIIFAPLVDEKRAAYIQQIQAEGHPVRCLLRPSQHAPRLPKDVPLQVAVAVGLVMACGVRITRAASTPSSLITACTAFSKRLGPASPPWCSC